jgi:hypothetical protein
VVRGRVGGELSEGGRDGWMDECAQSGCFLWCTERGRQGATDGLLALVCAGLVRYMHMCVRPTCRTKRGSDCAPASVMRKRLQATLPAMAAMNDFQ